MPSPYFVAMMTYFLLLGAVGIVSVERERYLRRRAEERERDRDRSG